MLSFRLPCGCSFVAQGFGPSDKQDMIRVKCAESPFKVDNTSEVSLTLEHFYRVVQVRDGCKMVRIDAQTFATFVVNA